MLDMQKFHQKLKGIMVEEKNTILAKQAVEKAAQYAIEIEKLEKRL